MVDKNLFPYDLAVVAIMKDEGPYLAEWLDYHLAAGVEHFYLYDNAGTDNQAEVAKPYVAAGIVDYFPAPGPIMQIPVFNDAVKRFKFQCRYMIFIDGDEFVFPKSNRAIVEVVDEILSHDQNAAGLSINWQFYGSSGHEAADYSRGVLERFTRRAPVNWTPDGKGNAHVKTIFNPRKINFISNPHYQMYFEDFYAVNENGNIVQGSFNQPVTANKIVINHYHCKSREEYLQKIQRGRATTTAKRSMEEFVAHDCNDVFDDGILRYRTARAENFRLPDKFRVVKRLFDALETNLSPTLIPNTPQEFYRDKTETFLTCRAVAAYLQTRLADDAPAKFFEEAALKAIIPAFNNMDLADVRLFLRELPMLLNLPYPATDEIRRTLFIILPQLMKVFQWKNMWCDYVETDYLKDLLKEGFDGRQKFVSV